MRCRCFPKRFFLWAPLRVPLATIGAALSARWHQLAPDQPFNWVFQYRNEAQADTRLMAGSVPDPHVVTECGARFRVHLLKGQNHGLFLDIHWHTALIIPPLIITEEQLKEGFAVLDEALKITDRAVK